MAYEGTGKREWIDEATLIKEVEERWFDKLIKLEAFGALLRKDVIYSEQNEEELPDRLDFSDDFKYTEEFRKKKKEFVQDWATKNKVNLGNL